MNKIKQKRVLSGKDRRLQIERRQFSYTLHIPERRSCSDRRAQMAANPDIYFVTADKPESIMAA